MGLEFFFLGRNGGAAVNAGSGLGPESPNGATKANVGHDPDLNTIHHITTVPWAITTSRILNELGIDGTIVYPRGVHDTSPL